MAAKEQSRSVDLVREVALLRPHLDAQFYLSRSPEVAAAGTDPVEHYCQTGWREGRDPTADFSTSYYLDNNPDIRAGGANPFLHYVLAGRYEGRLGRHPGGHVAEMLRAQRPLEECVRRWRAAGPMSLSLMPARAIEGRLRRVGGQRLILSVGHDNYQMIAGGVQVCIQREAQHAAKLGASYLNVHPQQSLPRLAHLDEDPNPVMNLILNGAELGACRLSALIEAVAATATDLEVETVVHHMLGHLPERLADLVRASGSMACYLWLHDFLTICPSYALQRNGVAFCGAPDRGSNACSLCLYGRERQSHSERIAEFFTELDVHVLSPSEVTKDFWERRSGLKAAAASVAVSEHLSLSEVKRSRPLRLRDEAPVTIGYAGTPAPHKGWPVFEALARKHRDLRFVFFGAALPPTSEIEHVPVHVTADEPGAMVDALAKEKVDLVVHWGTWPETFSLTAHEALTAGAFVLTNAVSGNVAAVVERFGRGRVLADHDDLRAFFEDGRLEAVVCERRARWESHTMTAEVNPPAYVTEVELEEMEA